MEANLEHTDEAITRKEWDCRFKRHVESLGIKLIPTSIKHPQTNGKIEKFFGCYNRYREK